MNSDEANHVMEQALSLGIIVDEGNDRIGLTDSFMEEFKRALAAILTRAGARAPPPGVTVTGAAIMAVILSRAGGSLRISELEKLFVVTETAFDGIYPAARAKSEAELWELMGWSDGKK